MRLKTGRIVKFPHNYLQHKSMIPVTPLCILLIFVILSFCRNAYPQETESGYIRVGENDSIYYESAGTGKTLILIHDGILHSVVWDAQFERLSGKFRVIRYDRRGYGLSSVAKGKYSNLDDLNSIFTKFRINTACLIACSSGGALAIDYTLSHPEKVDALVLTGAIVGGFYYTRHFRKRGGHLPNDFENDLEKTLHYLTDDPYIIYSENVDAKEKAIELVKKNPKRIENPPVMVHHETPSYQRLEEISVPALIIAGEYDIPDVHAHAGAINAGIPNSQRVIIPAAGHLVPFEKPELFNDAVLYFLTAD